jgi:predicted transcriptional regulator
VEWLTRQEEIALSLTNAKRTVPEIGRELGLPPSAVIEVLRNVGIKLRYFSTPSPLR